MKTITFYSYKGGVGRSLALSNVANRLAEFGKKVCIIDFDLEAPGMHLKFHSNIGEHGVKSGLVDYIYEFSTANKVPADIKDYVTTIKFKSDTKRSDISLIAAGNTLKKEYWRKLSAINWNDFFYENNSVGVDFFFNLKEQIRSQINPDFLLIDSKTGITDISGVTMSIFADEVVLLAANNLENIEGICQVMKTLVIPSNSILNQVPKINFVLCRIPYFVNAKDKPKETMAKNAAMKFINDGILEANIGTFKLEKVLVIHSDPELEMQEKLKIGYEHDRSGDSSVIPIGLDYLELFEEITHGVLTDNEKTEFNNFLKSEFLIEKAIANPDFMEKVGGLKAALKINPKSTIAYYELAWAYYGIDQFEKSIEYINEGLNTSSNIDHKFKSLRASIYLSLNKFHEAKQLYQKVLQTDPTNYSTLTGLAVAHYRLEEFDAALCLEERAVELYPYLDSAWSSYGNILRAMGRFDEAIDAIYKALEIDPQSYIATGTLAEIYAGLGNLREFYKNLELSFSFGMPGKTFQNIIKVEKIYRQFKEDEKFKSILDKYKIDVDLSVLK